jgi:hypothetical protein
MRNSLKKRLFAHLYNILVISMVFSISFFKALLINEGETTRGERE